MPASLQNPGDAEVRAVDVMVKREGVVRLVRLTATEEIEAVLQLLRDFDAARVHREPAAPAADTVNNNEAALDPHPSP